MRISEYKKFASFLKYSKVLIRKGFLKNPKF